MPDRSPDFWKTLRNFVREKNNISPFSRLVLYTTAEINDTSIFFEWTQKSPEVKLSLLESIYREPSETIREYCDLIFNFDDLYHRSDLLDILKRLEIRSSQKTIEEKYQDLKAHSSLIFVDEIFRDDLLKHLYAYISIKAIDNSYQWKVVYDDFIKDVQRYIRRYQQNEIPYPDLPAGVGYTGNETFLFITELKAIELENEIESAVIDYIRAQKNSFKLLELGGESVRVSIDNFESELKNKMIIRKQRDALDLTHPDIPTSRATKKSKELFLNCKLFDKLKIRGVQEIEMYFQHGKMHKIVDEQKFVWKFHARDLS